MEGKMEELDIEKKDIHGDIFRVSKLQGQLFEQPTECEEEWNGMPEYNVELQSAYQSILIHFRNPGDVKTFGGLVGQRITPKTKGLWYPEQTIKTAIDKRYVDES